MATDGNMTGSPVRALAVIGLLFWVLSSTEKGYSPVAPAPADTGPCAYEVFLDSEPFFAVKLDRPYSPGTIVSKGGRLTIPADQNSSNEVCPCAARLYLDNQGSVTMVEQMPAKSLVSVGAPINVNRATDKDLAEIPGIGPILGKSIIENRLRKGGYTSLDELHSIHGLGPKKISSIAKYVAFEDPNLTQQALVFPTRNLTP